MRVGRVGSGRASLGRRKKETQLSSGGLLFVRKQWTIRSQNRNGRQFEGSRISSKPIFLGFSLAISRRQKKRDF